MGIETEAGLEGLEVRQYKGGVHVFPAVIPGAGIGVRFSSEALIESCFSTEVLQTCLMYSLKNCLVPSHTAII